MACKQAFVRERRPLEFLSAPLLSFGARAKASPLESGRNCFFFCYSSVGLMCASLLGFQNWVFWGCVSQVEVLNIGVLDAGYKTFTQREAVSWDLPAKCVLPYHSCVYGRSVSRPFLPVMIQVFFFFFFNVYELFS